MKIRRFLALSLLLSALAWGFSSPPVAAQGAWYAEYFANRDLAGAPTVTRYENTLRFDWGGGSPGVDIPADNFSARWTQDAWFEAGTYRFSYRSDDGLRIWVDDTLVVDNWRDGQATWFSSDHFIPRGTHRVRVEYYEHAGGAAVEVVWNRIGGGDSWRGDYYANADLAGSPLLTRYDPAIDFDWGYGSPNPAIPTDNFSARWTHTLGFSAGTYRFYASCDDGVRVYVDGVRVIDAWFNQKLPNTRTGDITLGSGQHTVVVEYFERGGQASAHVWWNLLGSFSGWEGRYYDNPDLRGGPALIRDDATINFDWGEGAPASWMPSDNFSAVWTRQVNFDPGYYRLYVQSDDGARVWLDGALVMDYWRPMNFEQHYLNWTYLEGLHSLKVEYYERAGNARIHFWWETGGEAPPAPGEDALPTGPWRGEYFDSRDLLGAAVMMRSDAAVDFNWGQGAPATGMPVDGFSVRWSRQLAVDPGLYLFYALADDGIRVYLDGRILIDEWHVSNGEEIYSADANLTGSHKLVIEYYEGVGEARVKFWWKPVAGSAPRSAACEGGPLRLDAWPVAKVCHAGGWTATIFVAGHGGDCLYTYGWEDQEKGGPTPGSMTFEVSSAGFGAIVGEASVTSAGQTQLVGLYIPSSCR
jgi:hypothetical protein